MRLTHNEINNYLQGVFHVLSTDVGAGQASVNKPQI